MPPGPARLRTTRLPSLHEHRTCQTRRKIERPGSRQGARWYHASPALGSVQAVATRGRADREDWSQFPASRGHDKIQTSEQLAQTLGETLMSPQDRWAGANGYFRLYGENQVAFLWKLIRASGSPIPMQGLQANALWFCLLQDIEIQPSIIDHALKVKSESGIMFDRLYEIIIQRLLKANTDPVRIHILEMHELLSTKYFIRPGAINELLGAALLSQGNLNILRHIYKRGYCYPRQGIYDKLIGALCDLGEWKLAVDWHFFLISHNDTPSKNGRNALRHVFDKRPNMERHFKNQYAKTPAPANWGDTSFPSAPTTTVEEQQQLDESRHAPLSDEYCARLFATLYLPVYSSIVKLEQSGQQKIGPRTLRELMARASDASEAREYLGWLDKKDITLGVSVYARVVKQFVRMGDFELLMNLVWSDLHPLTLQDRDLQMRLLASYSQQGESLSARRTIEILKQIPHPDNNQEQLEEQIPQDIYLTDTTRSAGPFITERFEELCANKDLDAVQIMIDDLDIDRVMLGRESFASYQNHLTRPRTAREREKPTPFEIPLETNYAIHFVTRMLKSGHHPPARFINELIRRTGLQKRLQNVLYLSSFLSQELCSPDRESKASLNPPMQTKISPMLSIASALKESSQTDTSYISRIITQDTVQAIIGWGFKHSYKMLATNRSVHGHPASSLLFGLRYVASLARNGLPIDNDLVRNYLVWRLQLLYAVIPRLPMNRAIMQRNPYTLEEMVLAIEHVWPGQAMFPDLWSNAPPKPLKHNVIARSADLERGSWTYSDDTTIFEKLFGKDGAGENTDDVSTGQPLLQDLLPASYFSGSLLEGLLHDTIDDDSKGGVLSLAQRIQRRVDLRTTLLGTTYPPKHVGDQIPVAWDRHIERSARLADSILAYRGLCPDLNHQR